ncbi:unnamed protein product [Alternaria alternata]
MDPERITAADLACRLGHKDVPSILIAEGVDLDLVDVDGISLQQALENGHQGLALELIDLFPFKITTYLRWGPLQTSVRAGYTSIIKRMMIKYIDLAAALGDTDAVQTLIGAGADITLAHADTSPPLQISAGNNHVAIIKPFAENGADVNQLDDGGITALIVAVSNSCRDALEALLDMGASMQSSARGSKSIMQILLARGASAKTRDVHGRSALHYAVRHLKLDIADLLIEYGADPLAQDDIGSTPLDLAVCHGIRAADFIRKHMDDLTLGIIRRPSLLEAINSNQTPRLSSQTMRNLISGLWTEHYEYSGWQEGEKETFSIEIHSVGMDESRPSTFLSELEHDEIGDFQHFGFADQGGSIWFVKLYEKHGWLYRGRLDAEKRVIRGTWGSNRKLWFGSFELRQQ